TDRAGVHAFVECTHVVGPHAGGVDDAPGAHFDLGAVGDDARPAHVPGLGTALDFAQLGHARVVHHRRAVGGSRPRDGERQAGVVVLGVVVEVAAGDVGRPQRRH